MVGKLRKDLQGSGVGGKGYRRVMEGVEQTKVKYAHRRDTLGNPFEPLLRS
jgi:hypothetical protein